MTTYLFRLAHNHAVKLEIPAEDVDGATMILISMLRYPADWQLYGSK